MNTHKGLMMAAILGGMYLVFGHTPALAGPQQTTRGSLRHAGMEIRLLGAARLPSLQPVEPGNGWPASAPAVSDADSAADGSARSDRDSAKSDAVVSEQ